MSYYYKDSEYAEHGNYGNNNDKYECDSYLNYAEPNHFNPDPEPPPSKRNLHEYNDDVNITEYGNNTDRKNENEAEWETEENTYDGTYRHREPEYVTEGEGKRGGRTPL
jgi:hypothetical protein